MMIFYGSSFLYKSRLCKTSILYMCDVCYLLRVDMVLFSNVINIIFMQMNELKQITTRQYTLAIIQKKYFHLDPCIRTRRKEKIKTTNVLIKIYICQNQTLTNLLFAYLLEAKQVYVFLVFKSCDLNFCFLSKQLPQRQQLERKKLKEKLVA